MRGLLAVAFAVACAGCSANGCSTVPFGFFAPTTTGPQPPSSGLINWVKADAGVTKDGSNHVSAWADQSTGGHNWSNVGIGPGFVVWTANVQNSLPALSVDNNNSATNHDCLRTAPFRSGSQPGEVLAVMHAESMGAGVANYSWSAFGSYSATTGHYVYSDGTWYEFFGITSRPAVTNVGQVAAVSWAILDISVDSPGTNNWIARRNNTTFNTSTQTVGWRDGTPGSLFTLFASSSDTCSSSFPWGGTIGEVLFYDHVLSAGDRSAAYSYLSTKWAVP